MMALSDQDMFPRVFVCDTRTDNHIYWIDGIVRILCNALCVARRAPHVLVRQAEGSDYAVFCFLEVVP